VENEPWNAEKERWKLRERTLGSSRKNVGIFDKERWELRLAAGKNECALQSCRLLRFFCLFAIFAFAAAARRCSLSLSLLGGLVLDSRTRTMIAGDLLL
jgi:hypothetical protein